MTYPTMQTQEARANTTFRALLWALSHPGSIQTISAGEAGMLAIAEALLDLETSYYSPDPELHSQLFRTGARPRSATEAAYQFYPSLGDADLETLQHAPIGSYGYPDAAATLIIGCRFGAGRPLVLRGPGINGETELRVDQMPASLWQLRAETGRYPLGWDMFLCDGNRMVGLPRTTTLEVR